MANKRLPLSPKLIFTVSMALLRSFAPIIPAANIISPPIRCPSKIAAIAFPKPSGAKYVPVRISAKDTPAPNQISPFEKTEVLFSLIPRTLL